MSLLQGVKSATNAEIGEFENVFEGRDYGKKVEKGCALSIMSYVTFAAIAANTIININNVS